MDKAAILSWWLLATFLSSIALWISPGPWWLAAHLAGGMLALVGSLLHAKHGPSGSGWAASIMLLAAAATGIMGDATAARLGHLLAGLLVATAFFVHVAGRKRALVWGRFEDAQFAATLGLLVTLVVRVSVV